MPGRGPTHQPICTNAETSQGKQLAKQGISPTYCRLVALRTPEPTGGSGHGPAHQCVCTSPGNPDLGPIARDPETWICPPVSQHCPQGQDHLLVSRRHPRTPWTPASPTSRLAHQLWNLQKPSARDPMAQLHKPVGLTSQWTNSSPRTHWVLALPSNRPTPAWDPPRPFSQRSQDPLGLCSQLACDLALLISG